MNVLHEQFNNISYIWVLYAHPCACIIIFRTCTCKITLDTFYIRNCQIKYLGFALHFKFCYLFDLVLFNPNVWPGWFGSRAAQLEHPVSAGICSQNATDNQTHIWVGNWEKLYVSTSPSFIVYTFKFYWDYTTWWYAMISHDIRLKSWPKYIPEHDFFFIHRVSRPTSSARNPMVPARPKPRCPHGCTWVDGGWDTRRHVKLSPQKHHSKNCSKDPILLHWNGKITCSIPVCSSCLLLVARIQAPNV